MVDVNTISESTQDIQKLKYFCVDFLMKYFIALQGQAKMIFCLANYIKMLQSAGKSLAFES